MFILPHEILAGYLEHTKKYPHCDHPLKPGWETYKYWLNENILAIIAWGFVIICIAVMSAGFYFAWKQPSPPEPLTNAQMAKEMKVCEEYGLVLDVSSNRRYFDCRPPRYLK